MSIHNSTQICGDCHEIKVEIHHGKTWVSINTGISSITMQPHHVRALADAVDKFEAQKQGSNLEAAE